MAINCMFQWESEVALNTIWRCRAHSEYHKYEYNHEVIIDARIL